MYELTMDSIRCMAQAAQEECKKLDVGITLSIVDATGHLRYLQRFYDAIIPSIEISQNKAYTAATMRMSTAEFGKIAQPGQSAYGINITAPRLVIFGGGFPLVVEQNVVGGIGVSGGSVTQDEQVAHAVLHAFEQHG